MSNYNSINFRKDFGPPPAHYKQSRQQGFKPPDLELLTSGDRDYCLVFNSNQHVKVPLKWQNPFLGFFHKDLSEKWKEEILSEHQIEAEFLKDLKAEIKDYHVADPNAYRSVPDYSLKIELKKLVIDMHKRYQTCVDLSQKLLEDK